MNDASKRELLITRIADGFVRERVDVTGWSEAKIQQHMGAILLNPDFDLKNWLIRDTGWQPQAATPNDR